MGLAEKYMLFKGSNNFVQIYRLFSITGNYEGGAFLNMVFLSNRNYSAIHVMEQPPRFFVLAYRASDACIYQ
jgi:hypothetical protein